MSFFVSPTEFAITVERVAALNKRAAKAGITATVSLVEIDRKVIKTKTDLGFDTEYTLIEAELQGVENVVFAGGFKLAATLDHGDGGNIFRTVPSFEGLIPAEFRGTDATRCDHCNVRRQRNQTVLVFSETEGFKQVGSDCVKLFLGVSPASLIGFLREIEEISEESDSFGGGRPVHTVLEFVAVAALVTEVYGFVPKSFYDKTPTASIVGEFLNPGRDFAKRYPELASIHNGPADRLLPQEAAAVARANELAEAATAWIAEQDSNSDYIMNLRLAAAREVVGKNEGLLASLPNAFKKASATAAERAAKVTLPDSEHVGQIGEKVTFTGKVIYTARSEGYAWNSPESLFVILLAEDGTKFYANTTVETTFGILTEEVAKTDLITVTGTVKNHKVSDKGDKITVLTRCKAKEG
jgi:hypothetical protein